VVYPYLEHSLFRKFFSGQSIVSAPQVTELFEAGCSVLVSLERNKLLHLDIKPQNIMLDPAPDDPERLRPRLTDFGISHQVRTLQSLMSQASQRKGVGLTRDYAAPEQFGLALGQLAKLGAKIDV
jgi:serine/threonine protein kinase